MESAGFVFERKENRKEKACSGNKLQHVSYLPKSLSRDKKRKKSTFQLLPLYARYFMTVASVRSLEVFPNVKFIFGWKMML